MHITEDFLLNLMELIKGTRGGDMWSFCETPDVDCMFLSVKTLMLNKRKNRSDCSAESA